MRLQDAEKILYLQENVRAAFGGEGEGGSTLVPNDRQVKVSLQVSKALAHTIPQLSSVPIGSCRQSEQNALSMSCKTVPATNLQSRC